MLTNWSRFHVVVLTLLAAAFTYFTRGLTRGTVGQTALVLLGGMALLRLRALAKNRDPDYATHGRRIGIWHLNVTNLLAVAYGWFMYDGYRLAGEAPFRSFGSSAKDWMLASGVVGGVLALFRSTSSGSAIVEALRQNRELLAHNERLRDEVVAVRRRLGDASELSTVALDASQATDVASLSGLLARMVTIASDLPETSDSVDAFTVWVRDERAGEWLILSGRGVSEKTLREFRQPILTEITARAGILANLAVSKTSVFVSAKNTSRHEWYADDSFSERKTEGFAAVLVPDPVTGEPIGALCLTSEDETGIPSPESPRELQRFEKVLQLWSAAFKLPIQRYFELLEAD